MHRSAAADFHKSRKGSRARATTIYAGEAAAPPTLLNSVMTPRGSFSFATTKHLQGIDLPFAVQFLSRRRYLPK